MERLKNTCIRTFVVAALVVLSSVAYTTHPAEARDPRCDEDIQKVQYRYADAKRVEAQAIAAELTKQNSTVQAMTCMDQQLAMSARAGEIFSDTTPAAFPGLNPLIGIGLGAIGLSGLDPGARDSSLIEDFGNVIGGVLGDLLDDFSDAISGLLSDALGTAIGGFLGGFLGGALGAIFGGLNAQAAAFNCPNMNDEWLNNVIGQSINVPLNAIPSVDELLSGTPLAGAWPAEYANKFTLPDPPAGIGNQTILNRALTDKTVYMLPGGMNVYKPAPAVLNLNSTLTDVLLQMAPPPVVPPIP